MKNKFIFNGKDFGYLVDLFQEEMVNRFLSERNLELQSSFSLREVLECLRFSLPTERGGDDIYCKMLRWRDKIINPLYKKWLAEDPTKDRLIEIKNLVQSSKDNSKLELYLAYLSYAYDYSCLVISESFQEELYLVEGFVSYLFMIETSKFKKKILDGSIVDEESCKKYVESVPVYTFALFDCVATIEGTTKDCMRLHCFLESIGCDVEVDVLVDGSKREDKIGRYTYEILGFSSIEKDIEEYVNRCDCEFIAPF